MHNALVAPTRTLPFARIMFCSYVMFLYPNPAGFLSLLAPPCPRLFSLCADPVGRQLPLPPPRPCVRCRVGSFSFLFLDGLPASLLCLLCGLVFYQPPCKHAGHGITGLLLLRLLSCLFSGRLAPMGLSPWCFSAMSRGRSSLVSPPLRSLPRPALHGASLALPPTLLLVAGLVCAVLLLSSPRGYLPRPHAPLHRRQIRLPVGQLRRSSRVPLWGNSSVARAAALGSISSLMVKRGGWYSSIRHFGMLLSCG